MNPQGNSPATSTALWQLSLIMIVITSWLLYRYVAPKGWREWTRAGLVQAFIIALYAEMYGFPLTIYLLSGFLGIDVPGIRSSGHLWAALFGWGTPGTLIEMASGYTIVFLGLALLVEGWREVYVARRDGRLASERLYGVVRHPQYTGIFLAVFGQLVHWPTIPTLALFPLLVWAYVRLARREEGQMVDRFGDEYRVYEATVPAFFPGKGQWRRLLEEIRWAQPQHNRQSPGA